MNRLTKKERLRSRKQIEALLSGGENFFMYPFRVIYSEALSVKRKTLDNRINKQLGVIAETACESLCDGKEDEACSLHLPRLSSLLIAVPKRRIKKATARNLIKRRTREAWRLNKQNSLSVILIILQYVADEPLPYAVIEEAVKSIIGQLNKV